MFEDPKSSPNESMASAMSAQEWLDIIDRAKEIANAQSANNPYSENDSFTISTSALSSQGSTLDQTSDLSPNAMSHAQRATLHKQHSGAHSDSLKGHKRFSKRQSKSGLTAVF